MGILEGKNSPPHDQRFRNRIPRTIYQLRDMFLTPRLPGAVNGTNAEPGPGTRSELLNICSIIHGKLQLFNAGVASSFYYDAQTREPGRGMITQLENLVNPTVLALGWLSSGNINNGFIIAGTSVFVNYFAGWISILTTAVLNSDYAAVFLRSAGAYHFMKGDTNGSNNFVLEYITDNSSTASLTPGWYLNTVNSNVDNIIVPNDLWLPSPLLSDGFGAVPNVIDYGGVSDGTPTRVGLGGDARKAFFDGANSYCDIYSADVNNKFDGAEGSVIIRGRVSAAGVWADGNTRYILAISVNANNTVELYKTAAAGTLRWQYAAGAVVDFVATAGHADTGFMTIGSTWSAAADEFKAFKDGSQEGVTQNGLGVWAGNLSAISTVVGAGFIGPGLIWDGWIADGILLYGVVATPAQMATIHTHLDAGTLTEQILDSEFGINNWSWWKLNESFTSDGEGHAEGIAGGIGSGGDGLKFDEPVGAFDYLTNTFHCSFTETVAPVASPAALAVSDIKKQDIIISANLTRSAGEVGIVARYSTGGNYVAAYHNGANAFLDEYVSGVRNNLLLVAAAYGAGNPIRLILDGTAARLYYNDVLIGTAVIDVDIPSSTKHGAFSSIADNTIDDLTIYARGTNGEYELLESF